LHNARAKIACYFSIANVIGSIARRPRSRQRTAKQIDAAPLGVVKRVEGLPPELQSGMFAAEPGKANILGESDIPVIAPGAGDWTLPQVAKHARFVVGAQLRYGDLAYG